MIRSRSGIPITSQRPTHVERRLQEDVDDFNAAHRLAWLRVGAVRMSPVWGTA